LGIVPAVELVVDFQAVVDLVYLEVQVLAADLGDHKYSM
jgi:hypothetical protein